jgi:transposase
MGKKNRRVFDKEFKTGAVALATAGDRTATEVAASLDVNPSLLTKWIQASRADGAEAFRGHGKRTAQEEEIWRLKLKNKQLEQELEFLKKVSRYFAKDPK